MKTKLLLVPLVLIVLTAVFTGTAAAADEPTDDTTPGMGPGRMIRAGFRMMSAGIAKSGVLHEYMVSAAAEALDLTVAEVETAREEGITLRQLALDNGIAEEDLLTFLKEVRLSAIDKAEEAGAISTEQAEFLTAMVNLRGTGRMGRGGLGTGPCLVPTTTP